MPKAKFVADNPHHRPHAEDPLAARDRDVPGGGAADLHRHPGRLSRRRGRASPTPRSTLPSPFAQLARGGETGDGYQIGINQYGTHCGKPYGHVVRPGDLINLYISNVTYQGYTAQTARMIAVGEITARQEKVLAACTEGVKRAEKLLRPGALISDVNNAAFELLYRARSADLAACANHALQLAGGRRRRPAAGAHAICAGRRLGGAGRKLMHVYPATHGPHNPNLGHSVGMAGAQNSFNVSSHNHDRLEEGMVFVLHTQWLEAQSAGCNIGDCYLVTADGFENLSRHTPLETFRVPGPP